MGFHFFSVADMIIHAGLQNSLLYILCYGHEKGGAYITKDTQKVSRRRILHPTYQRARATLNTTSSRSLASMPLTTISHFATTSPNATHTHTQRVCITPRRLRTQFGKARVGSAQPQG